MTGLSGFSYPWASVDSREFYVTSILNVEAFASISKYTFYFTHPVCVLDFFAEKIERIICSAKAQLKSK